VLPRRAVLTSSCSCLVAGSVARLLRLCCTVLLQILLQRGHWPYHLRLAATWVYPVRPAVPLLGKRGFNGMVEHSITTLEHRRWLTV
jgi:hypothetical protein